MSTEWKGWNEEELKDVIATFGANIDQYDPVLLSKDNSRGANGRTTIERLFAHVNNLIKTVNILEGRVKELEES